MFRQVSTMALVALVAIGAAGVPADAQTPNPGPTNSERVKKLTRGVQ